MHADDGLNRAVNSALSLDGGGVMGIVSAVYLEKLEARLKNKHSSQSELIDYFQLLAGTSTGSILACGLSSGRSPSEIKDIYLNNAAKIFGSPNNRLGRLLWEAKFDGDGLRDTLQQYFKTKVGDPLKFSSPAPGETYSPSIHGLRQPTMVCAYDIESRRPIFFKSWRKRDQHHDVWKVCLASCSEPTYFPPVLMKLEGGSGAQVPLVGGGVVANNPVAPALAEAIRLNKQYTAATESNVTSNVTSCVDLPSIIASFGTGKNTKPLNENDVGSVRSWVSGKRIIGVFMDAGLDVMSYITERSMGRDNYFRFNPELPDKFLAMDNPAPHNLRGLHNLANAKAETSKPRLEELASRL